MGTGIEWCDEVWNPTTGCDRISAGCDNCYALTMAKRLKGMGQAKYQNDGDPRTSGPGFGLTVHPAALATPLTKRARRMRRVVGSEHFYRRVLEEFDALRSGQHFSWPPRNVWLGTSIESQEVAARESDLLGTPAAVRFISAEPLIGPVDFAFDHECGDPPHWTCPVPDWLIIGGESGANARPMDLDWARDVVTQCRDYGVAVFVKQLGSVWAHENDPGGHHKGGDWDSWPADLRVREFPQPAGTADAA